MRVFTIVGARPQFVKAATISRVIGNMEGVEEILVHTGQHFDHNMSDVFFEEMSIPKPDYNLDIHSLSHGAMTGRMLEELEKLMVETKPDCVLVYGDTNSTLAGALAAKKLHIPIGHVEAGLRSFNDKMPEEVNRILTDRMSNWLFCPTGTAVRNLSKEGYENLSAEVIRTGDVMYDAAKFYASYSSEKSQVDIPADPYVLVTVHRAENTDDPERLKNIIAALNKVSRDYRVVLPIHPRTAGVMKNLGLSFEFDTIDPVGYFDMIELLKGASLVMTDSGGLQKEAFFFETACVTLRDQTEWVELVENGFNSLADVTSQESILSTFEIMIGSQLPFDVDLYGTGTAAEDIVGVLKNRLGRS